MYNTKGNMHYKNGREAKVGDKVLVPNGNYTFVGVVAETVPGASSCNIHVVPLRNSQIANCGDCTHLADIEAVVKVNGIPDSTKTTNVGD